MTFDIGIRSEKEACEAGYTFEPTHPGTRRGIGASITVRGPRSEAARAFAQAKMNELRDRQDQSRVPLRPSIAEVEANLIETAVMYTMDWSGFTDAGVPVPFSPAAARALYTRQETLRDQVLEKAGEIANFLKFPGDDGMQVAAAAVEQ
ncbi:MAG TPA: hypothetical protein VLJ58_04685 [Ramlibacter sp.]|nr:hypothetical protein [Ramlibacter sp.]